MKTRTTKRLQKVTAVLLSAIMVLSVFAVMPTDLFNASAASVSFDDRLELDFNNNWKFNLGNESGAYTKAYDDSAWETVELPHDFSISQDFFTAGTEAESGNLPGGTGWYRKTFAMSSDARDKSVILNFDGSYKDTYVYVNGELIGENHYGYNSFSFEISEYLVCNGTTANIVAVKVENQLPSSRWYSGSGIYRDVTMTIVDPVHVDLYGTYVTTPNLQSSNGADGTVNAVISLTNAFPGTKEVVVKAEILDSTGAAVGTAATSDAITMGANEKKEVTLTPVLSNPNLWNSWDLGSPYLYTLRTTISENGTVIDTYDTEFGYRWFNWDLDGGFSLNGQNVKLEGVCLHHDQGVLGAAQVYDAIYRQVSILKDMGCNAIRTSHGTPSDVFMDVCNKVGMLVMDEFFDGWDTAKNDNSNDFSVYFDQTIDTATNNLLGAEDGQMWYEYVLTQSVKRDRNDPAVVIWDVGNEISEGASVGNFETIAANMRDMLDTLDPTRPICQGNNQRNVTSGWPYNVEKYLTVVGGNYQPATWAGMYSQIAALTDAKTGDVGNPFVMTETTSATSTRGVYDTLSHYNYACSGYDTDYVSWGTSAAGTWYPTITNDWFSGAFVWTGFDYIGEPTHWNHTTSNYGTGSPVSSFFGIVDTAGFAKDTYYLYRSMWNEHSTTLHLVPGTWDSNELAKNGNYAYVAVYSNADHIELLGDGNVIATAQSTTTTTNAGHKYQTWTETANNSNVNTTEFYTGSGSNFYPQFQVNYSAYSTISVKAYDANGNDITASAVGTKSVSNVEATKIVASTWADASTTYTADGDSYVYIEYTAQDANGNIDTTYNGTIDIELTGNGATFVGVDNGNQTETQKFQQSSVFKGENTVQVQMFNGKALVVLRTNEEAGQYVKVTTTATDDLSVNGVEFTTADEAGDELVDEFEEAIPQPENLTYEPTLYDKYEALYNKITAGGTATGGNRFEEYSATPNGTTATVTVAIPDGEYVITGADDQGGTISSGVLTHAWSNNSFASDGSTGTPATTSDTWYFESTDGGYYIYYTDSNGEKQYLTISNNQLYVSTSPYVLKVEVDASGNVLIGFGSSYINYSGNENNPDTVGLWTAPTNLTLYKVTRTESSTTTTTAPVKKNNTSFTSGEQYIITQANGYVLNDDLTFTQYSGDTPPTDSDTWTITEEASGQYQISNSAGQYISLTGSGGLPQLVDSVAAFNYSYSGDTLTIYQSLEKDCDNNVNTAGNYYFKRDGSSVSASTSPGTDGNLNIWQVETTTTTTPDSATVAQYVPPVAGSTLVPPVENGVYVIYNNDSRTDANYSDGILTNTIDSVGIPIEITAPVDGIITTDPVNAYTFTLVDGTTNDYYIQNSEGKYLSFGTSGGSIAFSDSATSLKVYGRTDGSIFIYNDSNQFLDHWYNGSTQDHYNTWESTTSATDVNRIFNLYRNESGGIDVPAGKEELYNALYDGVQVVPGTYSNSSYQPLFTALEDGYDVFNSETATDEEIANAAAAIRTAMAGLEIEHKFVPTTLYKYGYNPSSSTPYSVGGATFNATTYASMEAIIRADADIMAQIEAAVSVDNDGNALTLTDEEKETAITTAVEKYAKIYSLSFTGNPITGLDEISNFERTKWNVWTKSDTQGAAESTEEGASVQGLFSALRVDGQPVDHAAYDTLPYGNAIDNANRESFNTIDGLSISYEASGTSVSRTLPALEGISVHINDMFKKELVLADGTVATDYDASAEYAKFYWDLQFPLQTTTNEYGINTYEYKSSSTEYVFQANFDDANKSATAVLTPVDDWSVERQGKGAGTGFFPFNYRNGTTTYTGENAIYHYAFNYDMEFYIPMSGTYADGEDVIFEFSGDDDVLVYIDDVLVLDNGGLHGARKAAINFTEATISYQYAMDVTDDNVESTTENDVTYAYGAAASSLNGDELAALEKLNEVRSDGDYHTFSFYYVERGSTDSNCEISFNLQQSSEHVLLHDQTVVVDFGLPVEGFNITGDNFVSQDAKDAGTKIELMGVMPGNTAVADIVDFDKDNVEAGLDSAFSDTNTTLTVNEMKYGDATVTKTTNADYANADNAIVSYTPNTTKMTGMDYFYICSEVTNDPTYAEGTVYYQYEKVGFIPATSIYFEDNFGAELTFENGTAGDGSNHGTWITVGDESLFAGATQAADLAEDSSANPYGFDPVYAGADDTKDYTNYSGFSAQKVTVSTQNSAKNGGSSPKFKFSFTGTGFDVISLTDTTTGMFSVDIYKDGVRVGKRLVVDTYYGFSYGQLYADASGEATLEVTDVPLYKSADNSSVTRGVTYYSIDDTGATIVTRDVAEALYLDISGVGYTDTPTYYDADGNLTETETDDIAYAYAYAYGWIISENADVDGLYQIPVIKKTGLDYGTYDVVITPTYSEMFDNTDAKHYDLYIDAIRIYDPAGKDNGVSSDVLTDYKHDNESYPNYIELRDMLIGADSLSKDSAPGVVFIDGIAALDNDLDKFKVAGPNNEIYLASSPEKQAIAFEIWATKVPTEVQIGVKAARGTPELSITHAGATGIVPVKTATEMNYIIDSTLPDGSKLTWSEVQVDGETYYRTNTIVLQNSSDSDSILSITNIKWTFAEAGYKGQHEMTAYVMAAEETVINAYSMMRVNAPSVDEPEVDEPTDDDVNTEIIPGDDDANDTNDEYQEELSLIQRIIKAITDFFKKIFGMA